MKVVRCPPTGGIASVTSIGCAAPRKAIRSIAGSTCTPSTIMPKKTPGDSSAAAIGPGSRLPNGRIALKRCVKPVRPSAMAARVCFVGRHRMAETDADAGLREWRTKPAGTHSGASVTSVTPGRGARMRASSSMVGSRKWRGSCTPGFSGDRNGPSRWMPSTPASSAPPATAASASFIFPAVSLISVGSRRCRAEPAMRGRDGADALDRRFVVEQHVAAAIHLHIDEAGREPDAIR